MEKVIGTPTALTNRERFLNGEIFQYGEDHCNYVGDFNCINQNNNLWSIHYLGKKAVEVTLKAFGNIFTAEIKYSEMEFGSEVSNG